MGKRRKLKKKPKIITTVPPCFGEGEEFFVLKNQKAKCAVKEKKIWVNEECTQHFYSF